ncbi:MAG: hypothetical protein AB4057_09590 [Crocosphaera sp.]
MRLFRKKGLGKKIVTFSLLPNNNNNRVLYYLLHISSHLKATEVMKNGSWIYNNLDYQYHYDIFGFGFKTSNYYQENQYNLQLDINQDSETACINKLRNNLDRIIHNNEEMKFSDLCDQTMEFNPATINHYHQCLKFLRSAGDIEILRKRSKTKWTKTNSKEIVNNDIIRKSQQKKLFLLQDYIKE